MPETKSKTSKLVDGEVEVTEVTAIPLIEILNRLSDVTAKIESAKDRHDRAEQELIVFNAEKTELENYKSLHPE